MIKQTKKIYYKAGVAMTMGMMGMSVADANAQVTGFSVISNNVVNSIGTFPSALSALAYLVGLALGILGIMKVKDHVENPGNTPLKEGAIRLAAGGALLAIPSVFDAMIQSIGESGTGAEQNAFAGIELGGP